jgi:hypothetical protein
VTGRVGLGGAAALAPNAQAAVRARAAKNLRFVTSAGLRLEDDDQL